MPGILDRLREAAEYARAKKFEYASKLTQAAGGQEAVDKRGQAVQEARDWAHERANEVAAGLPGPHRAASIAILEAQQKAVEALRKKTAGLFKGPKEAEAEEVVRDYGEL